MGGSLSYFCKKKKDGVIPKGDIPIQFMNLIQGIRRYQRMFPCSVKGDLELKSPVKIAQML